MNLLRIMMMTIILWSIQAMSNTDGFKERFRLIRNNDGQLVEILDNSMAMDFSVKSYLESLKNDLLQYQQNLTLNPNFKDEVLSSYEDEAFTRGERSSDNLKIIERSLEALEKLNLEMIFAHQGFKAVITGFEDRLKQALSQINPNVLANVVDHRYFYKRQVTYQVLKWGLNFAQKSLSSIPVLNTVSHIMVDIENKVSERRQYHQNILLHYLNNFDATELGMTKEEVDHVFSSIYESRIAWWGILESNRANERWDVYGTDLFYSSFRLATKKLIANRQIYTSVDQRLNFAFQKVTFENEEMIINLFDKENLFNSKPAIAFYVNQPKKIMKKRMMINMAELGLSFISLPNFVKSSVQSYLKSFHESQKINEGALFAYFESNEDQVMMDYLKLQYNNPFEFF